MADAIFSPGTRAALMGCLDDIDTLLAENAELFEDLRAVLAGACTSATRAGARDATLRRLEAENAWLDRARKARR